MERKVVRKERATINFMERKVVRKELAAINFMEKKVVRKERVAINFIQFCENFPLGIRNVQILNVLTQILLELSDKRRTYIPAVMSGKATLQTLKIPNEPGLKNPQHESPF